MEKEIEQFTNALQKITRDADLLFSSSNIAHPQIPAQSKAAAAIAVIRDAVSQLAASPREPIQLHNLITKIVEQLLYAYRNGDTLLPQQHHPGQGKYPSYFFTNYFTFLAIEFLIFHFIS